MSALKEILLTRIRQFGPMGLDAYMLEALLHPEHGYYATRDPFGSAGDFTTAPEISQMFGEMIGLALAQTWMDQGAPARFALVELGPGRGTLMTDILRATRSVAGFGAAEIHLVEASAVLRQKQVDTIGATPIWHDTAQDLPQLPCFVIANEFFDALPIRQFLRKGEHWHERVVSEDDGALILGLAPARAPDMLSHRLSDTKEGDLIEVCPMATGITDHIAHHIATYGGAFLALDYGDWRSQGDTLQALKSHSFSDILDDPGNADITAHVDFEPLHGALSSHKLNVSLITPQGVFLERLGITARAQALAKNLTEEALEAHIKAHHRLCHPSEMGALFKVIGATPADQPMIPGLETRAQSAPDIPPTAGV
ncbi:MAG: class I SAM-dependent methyltransferase [Halocynthiibacter sp.]